MREPDVNKADFVLLSLGSNLGDRSRFLDRAVECLKIFIDEIKVSSKYETEPYGVESQPKFLNIALSGRTQLSPFTLLYYCKTIEYLLGRQVRKHWHEREIDIDIVLFGEVEISLPLLEIPHKGIAEREFVVKPAMEIEPQVMQKFLSEHQWTSDAEK